jgi:phage terminase large subunit
MATLEIKHTPVFEKNWGYIDTDKRFIINQGGSRSSKTYSLCQLIVILCMTQPNKLVSIVRKSFPSLRGSVMRDFFEVMRDLNLYSVKNHNKTENLYQFDNGSVVEFFAVDDEQKLRGRKRDILWANEANELNFEEFNQLNMRTGDKLFFDFNPSDNYHWIYDLISRPESVLIHSTYKDNPFLPDELVKEIESLIKIDEGYYRIYALGERSIGKTTIFTHWKYYEGDITEYKEKGYGLDFGYNHPTSLIEATFIDDKAYVKEIIYKSGLTAHDLVQEMNALGISKSSEIICDYARPEIIEDLKRAGYNAKNAIKDVKPGIDSVKSTELFINKESINLLKELSNYKWKSNGDIILDEPIKVHDDAVDAMRYIIHWWKSKNKRANKNTFRIHY